MYQPKTGADCSCRLGVQRDNCSRCEGKNLGEGESDYRAYRTPALAESEPLIITVLSNPVAVLAVGLWLVSCVAVARVLVELVF